MDTYRAVLGVRSLWNEYPMLDNLIGAFFRREILCHTIAYCNGVALFVYIKSPVIGGWSAL